MPAKLELSEVLARISRIHGDQITFDTSTFVGTQRKARFTDCTYGEWWTSPKRVYEGHKHPKRAYVERRMPAKLSLQAVCDRLLSVHNGNVMLVCDTYTNVEGTATFIDVEYGEWRANPHNVLRGSEHPHRAQRTRTIALNTYVQVEHWRTGNVCYTQSGWECGVLLWLNKHRYDSTGKSRLRHPSPLNEV